MQAGVEARIVLVPAVAPSLRVDVVPSLQLVDRPGVDEIPGPVLLAGEVRSPRRDSVGAVVQRPERHAPGGISSGPQQGVSGRWAGEEDWRIAGDPPAVSRRTHDGPPPSLEPDLDDAHSVGGLGLCDLLRGP